MNKTIPEEKQNLILEALDENQEVAFIVDNVIVHLQTAEFGYDFSFFNDLGLSEEINNFDIIEDFEQTDFEDALIDGGSYDDENGDSEEFLRFCLDSLGDMDKTNVPLNEAEYICTECCDPDCDGCNN